MPEKFTPDKNGAQKIIEHVLEQKNLLLRG